MSKEIIIKEAYKCYNLNYGYCGATYNTKNEVCLWCLDNLIYKNKKVKKPDILKSKIIKYLLGDSKEKEIKKIFKFPLSLIEFPLKKDREALKVKHKKINYIEVLDSIYGEYAILTPRQFKPFDNKILIATLYFSDHLKNRNFINLFKDWIELLEVKDTGYYRGKIIESLAYLTDSTIIHYNAWDYKKSKRIKFGEIDDDFDSLPSFAMFHILNEFKYLKEKGKRKSKIKIKIGETFYNNVANRYTLLELEKILPLNDISLQLYLFIKKQYEKHIFVKIPYSFEKLKEHIGITDKNITTARETFENAFKDLKDRKLIKDLDYKIYLDDDKVEKINFRFIKELKP